MVVLELTEKQVEFILGRLEVEYDWGPDVYSIEELDDIQIMRSHLQTRLDIVKK